MCELVLHRDMVAASVVQTLRLSTVGRGGSPTGSEDALISTVRKRLGAPLKADGDAALRLQLIHGLEPLVTYLRATLPEHDFALLLAGGLDDAVFELFKLVSQRTRYMKKFAVIIDSDTEWARVARGVLSGTGASPCAAYCDLPGQVASASDLDSFFSEVVLHAEPSVDIMLDWICRLSNPLLPSRLDVIFWSH